MQKFSQCASDSSWPEGILRRLGNLQPWAAKPKPGFAKGTTWTLKVCRIIAFCRYWAIILLTFEGLGIEA